MKFLHRGLPGRLPSPIVIIITVIGMLVLCLIAWGMGLIK